MLSGCQGCFSCCFFTFQKALSASISPIWFCVSPLAHAGTRQKETKQWASKTKETTDSETPNELRLTSTPTLKARAWLGQQDPSRPAQSPVSLKSVPRQALMGPNGRKTAPAQFSLQKGDRNRGGWALQKPAWAVRGGFLEETALTVCLQAH